MFGILPVLRSLVFIRFRFTEEPSVLVKKIEFEIVGKNKTQFSKIVNSEAAKIKNVQSFQNVRLNKKDDFTNFFFSKYLLVRIRYEVLRSLHCYYYLLIMLHLHWPAQSPVSAVNVLSL